MGIRNFNPWSFGAGVLNAGVSIWSQHQQNKNIDKQLSAQQRENANNRAYNLKLAKMQNQWNRQQWNMENAYNSPAAQIERLKAAGLNPDMMYGGPVNGNLSVSSPQMTSGAPSSPMDWSNIANKQVVGVDVLNSFLDAQIKHAQLEGLNDDNERKDIENKYLDAEKQLGIKLSKQAFDKNSKDIEILLQTIDSNKIKYESLSTELILQKIDSSYRAEVLQKELDILSNELKLKKNEVENMVRAKVLELAGKEVDNKLKEAQLKWNDPSILEKLGGDGSASLLKILMMLFK